jgi:hypothetical protein
MHKTALALLALATIACGDDAADPPAPVSLIVLSDVSHLMGYCLGPTDPTQAGAREPCNPGPGGGVDRLAPTRLEAVREAVAAATDEAPKHVQVSFYAAPPSESSCVAPERLPGDNAAEQLEQLGAREPGGGFPLAAGLRAIAEQVRAQADVRTEVVVFTSGQVNCNPDHPVPCACGNLACSPEGSSDIGNLRFFGEVSTYGPLNCRDETATTEALAALTALDVPVTFILVNDFVSGSMIEFHEGLANASGPLARPAVRVEDPTQLRAQVDAVFDRAAAPRG